MKNKLFVFLLTIFLFFSNSFLFGETKYVSLLEASENLGASLFWDPITSSGILEKNGNSVSFALDQEIVVFNYRDFSITEPPILQNDKVLISIKDFGIGIPKESLNMIWDRFYKTDLSRGKDKKGTGLGLAIVKDIITAHNEYIDVVSTEGVGTEFSFALPRTKKETGIR